MNVNIQTWSQSYFRNGINKKFNSNNRSNHLSGDSGTSAVEEVVKIPGDSIGQNGEGVVGAATCNLDEEGEEEHVGDGEGSFDNLTEGAMSEAKVVEDDDPKENTGPYPHERQNEV